MPFVSSGGGRIGNPVFGKLFDGGIQSSDLDGTTGGKYSRVSFGRRPW